MTLKTRAHGTGYSDLINEHNIFLSNMNFYD